MYGIELSDVSKYSAVIMDSETLCLQHTTWLNPWICGEILDACHKNLRVKNYSEGTISYGIFFFGKLDFWHPVHPSRLIEILMANVRMSLVETYGAPQFWKKESFILKMPVKLNYGGAHNFMLHVLPSVTLTPVTDL
jgi:hypothetical protein